MQNSQKIQSSTFKNLRGSMPTSFRAQIEGDLDSNLTATDIYPKSSSRRSLIKNSDSARFSSMGLHDLSQPSRFQASSDKIDTTTFIKKYHLYLPKNQTNNDVASSSRIVNLYSNSNLNHVGYGNRLPSIKPEDFLKAQTQKKNYFSNKIDQRSPSPRDRAKNKSLHTYLRRDQSRS